jgi:16S rRNA (cytosine967-C5)-methyltransferase
MSTRRPKTARSIAAETLCEAERHREFAGEILKRYPKLTERQRATDLVFGVIRNRRVIDIVIERFSSFLIVRVPEKILSILRVGIYELIYCPQTPEYAIVDEAVEYAKSVANAKQAGFVNAVLRQTLRHIMDRQKVSESYLPSNIVPQTIHTGCQFSVELFPDRNTLPVEYLSIAFSLPGWLVKHWIGEYGQEKTDQICFASNRRPSIYLRLNLLRTTVEELVEMLRGGGLDCETVSEINMIKLNSPGVISNLPGFEEGLFTVQDISASMVVRTLQPEPGWAILDLCSAPGTKTTQFVEMTGGKATIIATDIDGKRLEMVKENVSRLGFAGKITVIEFHAIDEYLQNQGGFDCVLVDAPCSNTGVLARRPEVRHRISQRDIKELTKVQYGLLNKAVEMLNPRGVLCYSTCSIQPEENGLLVRQFLERNAGFELKAEKLTLPFVEGYDYDGGYVAVLAHIAGDAGR